MKRRSTAFSKTSKQEEQIVMLLGECKRITCLEWAAKWQVKDSYLWHWRTFYAGVMFKNLSTISSPTSHE
jgi:hypothetical protein